MKLQQAIRVAAREARTFAGRVYRSQAEMRMARWLEAGDALEIHYEPKLMLGDEPYRPDFFVVKPDYSFYVEVKAMRRTPVRFSRGKRVEPKWKYVNAAQRERMRRITRLWAKYGPAPLQIWTVARETLVHVKTIEGGTISQ